jgi:hypothetical protein
VVVLARRLRTKTVEQG